MNILGKSAKKDSNSNIQKFKNKVKDLYKKVSKLQ